MFREMKRREIMETYICVIWLRGCGRRGTKRDMGGGKKKTLLWLMMFMSVHCPTLICC